MTGGTEWIVDAHGCEPERLRDAAALRRLCDGVVAGLALTVVGEPQVHRFGGPGGVTALYLLAESHLACHTYPESGLATFNLYCCRGEAMPAAVIASYRSSDLAADGSAALVQNRLDRLGGGGVDWPELLREALGAARVTVTVVPRGTVARGAGP